MHFEEGLEHLRPRLGHRHHVRGRSPTAEPTCASTLRSEPSELAATLSAATNLPAIPAPCSTKPARCTAATDR